jgi:transcription termination/antitermination protein NusG
MSSIADELDDDDDLQESDSKSKAKEPARWYAVQVASGCENRVKIDLTQRIHSFGMGERIYQIEYQNTC